MIKRLEIMVEGITYVCLYTAVQGECWFGLRPGGSYEANVEEAVCRWLLHFLLYPMD